MIGFIFFWIAWILILYDVINTEIAIYKYKLKEKNIIMKCKYIRWILNIVKIFGTIRFYLFIYHSDMALLISGIIWLIIYGIVGFKNTISIIKKAKKYKLIDPKPIKKYIITNKKTRLLKK